MSGWDAQIQEWQGTIASAFDVDVSVSASRAAAGRVTSPLVVVVRFHDPVAPGACTVVNLFVFDRLRSDVGTGTYALGELPNRWRTGYAVGAYLDPPRRWDFADSFSLDQLGEALAEWALIAATGGEALVECDACGRRTLVTSSAGGPGYHYDEGAFCARCTGGGR